MSDLKLPILVFTDLDGTLLDHDSYSFSAANKAINKLKSLNIPIIPVTSKTLSELEALLNALDLDSPVIAENGGIIATPKGKFKGFKSDISYKNFDVLQLSPVYSVINHTLREIREKYKLHFTGFNDLTVKTVAELTGLTIIQSFQAKERLCSEPLVWQDSPENLLRFEKILNEMDFSLTRGGRFYHVMGKTDKGKSMLKLSGLYPGNNLNIALGDSPNDISMLSAADFSAVINRKNNIPLVLDKRPEFLYESVASGPSGWQEFFDYFFKNFVNKENNEFINIKVDNNG